MSSFNQCNLDVKNTVKSTLKRAQKWLLASYPSDVRQDSKVKIDVRHAGEKTPFAQLETFDERVYASKKIDYTKEPVFVQIRRGQTNIVLEHHFSGSKTQPKKESYSIFIQARNGDIYRVVETPDGQVVDGGNPLLVRAAQQDRDFSKLIDFVKAGNPVENKGKWDLNQLMIQSRLKTR
ncbi:MAG: hypothetical protein E7021_01245 [Alphaproteobacteria bacterium]|nr:hypothetical protein [Alphaproteobacteria bacterium]